MAAPGPLMLAAIRNTSEPYSRSTTRRSIQSRVAVDTVLPLRSGLIDALHCVLIDLASRLQQVIGC